MGFPVPLLDDGPMQSGKIGRNLAWTFSCKTLLIEKSNGFRSDEYGGQSAGVQNSAMFSWKNLWVVQAVWASAESSWKM
jgi:hypothetical protein